MVTILKSIKRTFRKWKNGLVEVEEETYCEQIGHNKFLVRKNTPEHLIEYIMKSRYNVG